MQLPAVLHYVVSRTRVGRVLVVMSRVGVVDVMPDTLDATPDGLLRSLRSRYPHARLVPDEGMHRSWAAAVVARIDGKRADFGVPIDLAWPVTPACPEEPVPLEYVYAS